MRTCLFRAEVVCVCVTAAVCVHNDTVKRPGEEGFEIVDGFIEVPFRISPFAYAHRGANLVFNGRTHRPSVF